MSIDLSKLIGGRLKILGQELNLGDVDQLKELRQKFQEAGATELLSDNEWQNRQSSIGRGHRRSLSDVGGIIPRSAGFAKGARPAPRSSVRKPVEPSPRFSVEEDKLIDEEFQLIPRLTEVFLECMMLFPELKDIECRATHSDELGGIKGTLKGKSVIILMVPEIAWGRWGSLKPIIIHELCHFIDPENLDEIFKQRADEKSQKLWQALKEMGRIRCSKDK